MACLSLIKLNISVKDNVVEMTQEQIAEIADNDVETTAGTQGEKGSGFGLYLIKELLQKINGQLTNRASLSALITIAKPKINLSIKSHGLLMKLIHK